MTRTIAAVAVFAVVGFAFVTCSRAHARVAATGTIEVAAAMDKDMALEAETHNGAVTVEGKNTKECSLKATVRAEAGDAERAEELVKKTLVGLDPRKDKMVVVIQKPKTSLNESVTVDLDMSVPAATPLRLKSYNGAVGARAIAAAVSAETHNGAIACKDVDGDVTVTSRNGAIDCTDVSGDVEASAHDGAIGIECKGKVAATTYNGAISCSEVTGDAKIETHNGDVNLAFAAQAGSAQDVAITTHNGSVSVVLPPDFAGAFEVHTSQPMATMPAGFTVTGSGKGWIKGVMGDGAGKVTIETHNGRVEVR